MKVKCMTCNKLITVNKGHETHALDFGVIYD